MPFDPAKYGLTPSRASGGFDPAKYGLKPSATAPGDSPDNPIDEEHPNMDWPTRAKAMNLTANSEHAARWLSENGWESKDRGDYNISIRPKGSKEPWRVLDKSKTTLEDLTDVVGGATNMIGQGIGHVVGAIGGALGGSAVAPGPGTAVGGIAGGIAGGGLGAAAEEGLRVAGLGKLMGMDPGVEETTKGALREGAYGLVGEGVGALLKPAAKGLGLALKWGEKKLIPTEVTGREIAKKQLDISTKRAGLTTEASDVSARTQPPIAAEAQARADFIAARQGWREDLAAARKAVVEKVQKLREAKIEPGPEEVGATRSATKTLSVLDELEQAGAKGGEEGLDRALHAKLGIDMLRPDRVMAKYVRRWPAFQQILKESFGDNFYTDITSAAMETRSGALRHLLRNEPERLATGVDMFKELISKELLTNPTYGQLVKEAGVENSLRRMATKMGSHDDVSRLNGLLERVAKMEGRPGAVTQALEEFQRTQPAAARARATRQVAATGIKAGRTEVAKAVEEVRKMRADLGVHEAYPQQAGPILGAWNDTARVFGFAGRGLEKISAKLGSMTSQQLISAAKGAPVHILSQIAKLLRNPSRLTIMAIMRSPGFREWAESNL